MSDQKTTFLNKVSKNSLYTALFNIWYLVTRLALVPFILNYISIEEYGLWAYCFIVLSYIGLAAFGFNTTYVRYAADYRSRHEDQKLNELLSTGLITMTLFSFIFFPIIYILISEIIELLGVDKNLHQTAVNLLLGSAAIFMMNFSFSGYQYILEGEQRIDLVRKIQIFASAIEIILLILFIKNGLGVESLLFAYGIRYLLIMSLNIFFAYRTFPLLKVSILNYRRDALIKFLDFGGRLQIIGFLSILNQSIDRILIAKFLQLEAVGFYETARKLPNVGMTLPSAVAGSMIPAAASLNGINQKIQIKNAVLFGTRYLMILSSIPYGSLIYFTPLIVEVWLGKGFEQVIPVIQILALGTFINLISGVGTACFRGTGNTQVEIQYMGLSFTALLILTPLALISFGLVGVASAYCFSQTLGTIYFLVQSNRELEIAREQFVFQVLWPVTLVFLSGLPFFMVCNFWIDLNLISRWEGACLLVTLISSYVSLLFLIFIFFKDKLLLEGEKQKLKGHWIFSLKDRLFQKQWEDA